MSSSMFKVEALFFPPPDDEKKLHAHVSTSRSGQDTCSRSRQDVNVRVVPGFAGVFFFAPPLLALPALLPLDAVGSTLLTHPKLCDSSL